jgi:3-oxoacyl-(acyl-carrier-protein) synthase
VALLSAHRLIGAGEADSALVLGLELANRFSSAGFGALQLLDPAGAPPWRRIGWIGAR